MTFPSDAHRPVSLFDHFADGVDRLTSRAPFFASCVLLVIIWAPCYFVVGELDTWQLMINTPTTIITFLLVALLQNKSKRSDDATQMKLNAIALAIEDVLEEFAGTAGDIAELRQAIGLEDRTGS